MMQTTLDLLLNVHYLDEKICCIQQTHVQTTSNSFSMEIHSNMEQKQDCVPIHLWHNFFGGTSHLFHL